jgi:hypothetical protein
MAVSTDQWRDADVRKKPEVKLLFIFPYPWPSFLGEFRSESGRRTTYDNVVLTKTVIHTAFAPFC